MNSKKIRVAIVEDDPNQMDYIIRCLADDYEALPFEDAGSFMRLYARQAPDLLLLDWMLPGISGIELVTRLRLLGNPIPIIMLSARCDEDSLVDALEAGANDFMVKPVRRRELNARLGALYRAALALSSGRYPEPRVGKGPGHIC